MLEACRSISPNPASCRLRPNACSPRWRGATSTIRSRSTPTPFASRGAPGKPERPARGRGTGSPRGMVRRQRLARIRFPARGLAGIPRWRIGTDAFGHRQRQDARRMAGAARRNGSAQEAARARRRRFACCGSRRCARSPSDTVVLDAARASMACRLPWTVGLRTGDTSSAERAKQAQQLAVGARHHAREPVAHALERRCAREALGRCAWSSSTNGTSCSATSAACRPSCASRGCGRWNPSVRTWGLSATLGNLEEALDAPRSPGAACTARVVRGASDKKIVIDTLIPPDVGRVSRGRATSGLRCWSRWSRRSSGRARRSCSPTCARRPRSGTRGCSRRGPSGRGSIGLHHGSLDSDVRKWVEQGLKEGRLKAVVATSSLDLGVDFSPVERVLQIGSPKGVARLLQRAGRSGHAPGQVSRVTCAPSHALEFVEAAAVRRAAQAGRIESRQPVERPLDLLTQHLVTLAAGEGFDADELKDEVRSTRAYRDLTDAEWQWALDFVTRGGDALKAYPDYQQGRARRRGRPSREGRGHREAPSHVDRHDRLRRVGGRALHERQAPGQRRGVVHRAPRARATRSSSRATCWSSCASRT